MKYIFLINLSKYLVIFFPLFLISGPFLTDFSGSLVGIFTMLFIIINRKYNYLNNNYFYFFTIVFIFLNLSSLLAVNPLVSLKSSLTYFRLIFFIFSIAYLINNFSDLAKKIYQIYFISLLILFLDSLLIINFNINILGNEVDGSSARIRSLFDDEEIMGSFVSRTLPMMVGLSYYFKNQSTIKYNIIMVFLSFFLILISGERTALGNFIIFLCFYFLIERKYLLWFLLSIMIVFLITFQFKKESLDRTINHTIQQSAYETNNLVIFSLRHTLHYYTAFQIFKDHPIFGSGIKSFRELCSEKKYTDKIDEIYAESMAELKLVDGCNTHPHHIYIQFLSEIGLIGFSLFASIFLYITYNLYVLFKIALKSGLNQKNYANYFFLLTVFISMFPLLPSGNYFNNWYIFINYFPIGFYLANKISKI